MPMYCIRCPMPAQRIIIFLRPLPATPNEYPPSPPPPLRDRQIPVCQYTPATTPPTAVAVVAACLVRLGSCKQVAVRSFLTDRVG